ALLTALGGAAIATMAQPLSAHAQARQPMRRIGVLTWWSEYDPEGQSQAVALAQGLAKLGWTEGVNVKIEYRRVFGGWERIDSRHAAGQSPTRPARRRRNTSRHGAAARDSHHPGGVHRGIRSDRQRLCADACATGRQTQPGLLILRLRSAANGWSFSRRSHRP